MLWCALTATLLLTTGCSWHHNSSSSRAVSAFDIKPGDCLLPPKDVKQEISQLQVVACAKPHTQEAYAIVKFNQADPEGGSSAAAESGATYPGAATLGKFADGACGQRYESYLGVA
jgi:hypothetical protein